MSNYYLAYVVYIVDDIRANCAESDRLLRPKRTEPAVTVGQGAISKADFRAKMSIAYKECLETKYWLSLLKDTGYIEEKAFTSIDNDAQEISKMLWKVIKTTSKQTGQM